MDRYNRHIILEDIGIKGQQKLGRSKVLVVGAGGLGCPVLQYLAAAGVGTIGIIDFDNVEESNLQRQILYGQSNLGQNKALAAKQRLLDINNTIAVEAFPELLTSKNVLSLFSNYDIIIDGTDNFATRYLINDASILTNKPVVYGAIYKFEGQVSVFNYKGGPSYRCLFPNVPNQNDIPNCSEVGVLGILPGIIGCMQANEALKIILGFKDILSGKLYCYNSKTTQVTTINIEKSPIQFENVLKKRETFHDEYTSELCDTSNWEITIAEALKKPNSTFIDVRELDELPQIQSFQHSKIPLSKIEKELFKIDTTKTIVLFCKSGVRSSAAVTKLRQRNIQNCYSIKNGVYAIENYFKTHA